MSRENIDVPVNTGLITFGDELCTATGKKYSTLQWKGCVRQRNEPYDLQEDTPSTGTPDTLFTPFFAPDEPDGNQYDRNTKTYSEAVRPSRVFNNYLCDTNA